MKKNIIPFLLAVALTASARADTALTINGGSPYGCFQNANIIVSPPSASGSFTLPGVTGTGAVQSSLNATIPTFTYPPEAYLYEYTIDVSGLSEAANHCVKLLIHFGSPQGCGSDEVFGSPTSIQSATLAPFGDITFAFGGGCLTPGQPAVSFVMFSEANSKTGVVTVIDDYTDLASGQTNEVRYNVTAIVPDIPPDLPRWLFPPEPLHIPYALFQGSLVTNPIPQPTNGSINGFVNGFFDFSMQLLDAPSNGFAVSPSVTQTAQVVNGIFSLPLPFDAVGMCDGSARWVGIGVRPSGSPVRTPFTQMSPLPITPTPQSLYAYTAGVVSDIMPGQAVTSLNGLTDAVTLQVGSGLVMGTNGNTLTISSQPGAFSDRNLKTDIAEVKPEEILAKVAELPIERWRYTNEVPGVKHVGPMAQDFMAAFGLGTSSRLIEYVDEQGVALAAIKGLNQKLETQLKEKDAQIQRLQEDMADLKTAVTELKGEARAPGK